MTSAVDQPSSTPRWHHPLLPGELRDEPDGRSARDWTVDVLMYLIALGIGVAVLADTWDEHPEVMVPVDIALGVAAFVALRWLHPAAVGVLTAGASIASGLAAGPGLVAGFNVALRGSRRAILAVVAVTTQARGLL